MNKQESLSHSSLSDICQQEFMALKFYAYEVIRNEVDAEEIVSKSCAKFADQLALNAGKFPTRAHAKGYLAGMVKKACIEWRRNHFGNTEASAQDIADDGHMVFILEKYYRLQPLLSLIDELPMQLRQVITLFFVKRLSIEEIAQELGSAIEVIYQYKHSAISQLREKLAVKKNPPFLEEL